MAKPEILKKVLVENNVDKNIINKINYGYENVTNKSDFKERRHYFNQSG